MGIVDNDILQDINKSIKTLLEYTGWDYTFTTDDGSWETALEFWGTQTVFHPPESKNWEEVKKNESTIKCPDLLDWDHRRIIEYEEEPKAGKRGGKLGKKGHVEESKKDSHRDALYKGFKLLKIWESEYKDGTWKEKLYKFLKGG